MRARAIILTTNFVAPDSYADGLFFEEKDGVVPPFFFTGPVCVQPNRTRDQKLERSHQRPI